MSPDDKFLALCEDLEGSIHIFDLQSGQLYARFERTFGTVRRISFRSDSSQVVCGDDWGLVELIDLNSRTRVWRSQVGERMWFPAVAFSPQNDLVAWLGRRDFGLLDATSGKDVVRQHIAFRSNQLGLAWAANATQLLTCGWDGVVCVWGVASARTTHQVHLLYQCDTLHRSFSCSFFDNHRYFVTDHGLFPIPPQHRPSCAADDLVPLSSETLLRLREDGWIWLIRGGTGERRVCWLLPTYRPVLPWPHIFATLQDSVRLVTDSQRLVVIDLKEWIKNAYPDS